MQTHSPAPEPSGQLAALDQAVCQAWRAYDNSAELRTRVNPSIPILFFGDLSTYMVSPLRAVTVGLNPSLREFPSDSPFSRFPLVDEDMRPGRVVYLDSLSSYFRSTPYSAWFNAWEPLLKGAKASYYGSDDSTALHTDICSPVATNPTWSRLSDVDRRVLEADGVSLWHLLLRCLKPQVVVLSIAKRYLKYIEFEPLDKEWSTLHTLERTENGAQRSRPYQVRKRWYDVGGERSLFVLGRAAQTPFGLISAAQKREIGVMMGEAYRNER